MSSRLSLRYTASWSSSPLHRPHANHRVFRAVLDTLEPLSGDRKCFRMINGVLAERTVKDVVPALKTNLEGLEKVLTELTEQYNTKTTEMEKWKVSLVSVYSASIKGPIYLTRNVEEEQCPGGAVGLVGQTPHAARRVPCTMSRQTLLDSRSMDYLQQVE